MLEGDGEGGSGIVQGFELALTLNVLVLKIGNLRALTFPEPARGVEDERLHPCRELRTGFLVVDNAELVFLLRPDVGQSEVEPLVEA